MFLTSAWFSGSTGGRPPAKPMTRNRPPGRRARNASLAWFGAHGVIDHVRAAKIAQRCAQIGAGGAVDHVGCPRLADHLDLVGAARDADHPRAHRRADLHRGQPDPPAAPRTTSVCPPAARRARPGPGDLSHKPPESPPPAPASWRPEWPERPPDRPPSPATSCPVPKRPRVCPQPGPIRRVPKGRCPPPPAPARRADRPFLVLSLGFEQVGKIQCRRAHAQKHLIGTGHGGRNIPDHRVLTQAEMKAARIICDMYCGPRMLSARSHPRWPSQRDADMAARTPLDLSLWSGKPRLTKLTLENCAFRARAS